jgi:hypothetical protein
LVRQRLSFIGKRCISSWNPDTAVSLSCIRGLFPVFFQEIMKIYGDHLSQALTEARRGREILVSASLRRPTGIDGI